MNKIVVIVVLVAVAFVALGATSYVYAQSPTPQAPAPGTGYGMMGRGVRGGMMGQATVSGNQVGWMHDEMIAVYAQKLGIPVDEVNARLAKGETMAQIAYSKGLTAEQFQALMVDARSQALDQEVKDGTLTQTQADWMKQRGAGMIGGRGRGMRGAGQGQFANPACPYYQANP